MAGKKRLGQRTWHFSDAGNKFDGRQKSIPNKHVKPISPALKRGVIRCKRCGSRVVANVDNCPFCGKSLKPFFLRLWFWVIIVIVVALGAVYLINISLPPETSSPSKPNDPIQAVVVGKEQDASIKDLSIGTTIAVGDLQVKVTEVNSGPISASGLQIAVVVVEFNNLSESEIILYSTQWMMQLADNKRVDTYVGAAQDGATISSNFEAYTLAAGGKFTGRLYFAGSEFTHIIYQPSALAYSEGLLVTWQAPITSSP